MYICREALACVSKNKTAGWIAHVLIEEEGRVRVGALGFAARQHVFVLALHIVL